MKRKKIKINYGNLLLLLIVIATLGIGTYYVYNILTSNENTKTEKKSNNETITKLIKLGYSKEESEEIESNMKENIDKIDKYYENLSAFSKIKYFHIENIERYNALKEKNNEYSIEEIITRVNARIDKEFYTNQTEIKNQDDPFVLVNKYYILKENYLPEDLINVGNNQRMRSEAGEALMEMIKDIKNEGMYLQPQSGYRDFELQSSLYNGYVSREGKEKADTYSARPGSSEHHTGLAIDVSKDGTLETTFENTKEFKWLEENAHKYGFILRYPKNKTYITGYMYEPWHYRYVGIEVATLIKNEGITFEEYCVKYLGTF